MVDAVSKSLVGGLSLLCFLQILTYPGIGIHAAEEESIGFQARASLNEHLDIGGIENPPRIPLGPGPVIPPGGFGNPPRLGPGPVIIPPGGIENPPRIPLGPGPVIPPGGFGNPPRLGPGPVVIPPGGFGNPPRLGPGPVVIPPGGFGNPPISPVVAEPEVPPDSGFGFHASGHESISIHFGESTESQSCGINEIHTDCVLRCNTCEYLGVCPVPPIPIINRRCFPGCDCIPGTFRNSHNECVLKELCDISASGSQSSLSSESGGSLSSESGASLSSESLSSSLSSESLSSSLSSESQGFCEHKLCPFGEHEDPCCNPCFEKRCEDLVNGGRACPEFCVDGGGGCICDDDLYRIRGGPCVPAGACIDYESQSSSSSESSLSSESEGSLSSESGGSLSSESQSSLSSESQSSLSSESQGQSGSGSPSTNPDYGSCSILFCPLGEERDTCCNPCDENRCDVLNGAPKICSDVCAENGHGCKCIKSLYRRDRDKKCVLPSQCNE